MTDAEIEQERKRIDAAPAPLYVDSKADERSAAMFHELVRLGVIADAGLDPADWPYEGDGTIVRPFLTLEQARDAQKPGQDIIIAGYARIGRAYAATRPDSVEKQL